MNKNHPKQMLYVSVQDKDSDPHLRFELEDYYPRSRRRIYTERSLDCFDLALLRQDHEWMADLGFSLIVSLLIPLKLNDKHDTRAHIVYPHSRGNNPVLRIDKEMYEHKPHRNFCGSFALPTTDVDVAIEDETLLYDVGTKVLEYLPIKPAYCAIET